MTTTARSQIVLYSILSALGLVTAFWFNSQAVLSGGNYLADGFTSPVDWVYSLDLLIGGIAGMAFMVLESRKLGFKWWPLLVALGFVTAFSFVFPLFLAIRASLLHRQALAGGRLDQFEFDGHRVDVWVPATLNPETPILVMHDGHNLFDPKNSSYGSTWGLLAALPKRIKTANKPLIIGVWQEFGENRVLELGPEDFVTSSPEALELIPKEMLPKGGYQKLGNTYQQLIAEKVLPVLADLYAIKLDPSRTAIAGSSMGGLASLYGMVKYPQVYGTALCYSTHWPIGGDAMVDWFVKNLPMDGKHRVWSDTGTIELDAAYAPFHARFVSKMPTENFVGATYPMTGHNEDWWAGRVEHPINWWLSEN
jgi:predicted alpha/beta superfamily hydrolase